MEIPNIIIRLLKKMIKIKYVLGGMQVNVYNGKIIVPFVVNMNANLLHRLIRVSVALGIIFLTLGGVIGYLYARTTEIHSNAWRTDPKIILTTITWAAYGILLFASTLPFFRGRRTAWAAIICFGFLVFTAWSTIFWSPFHNYL
jgi:ABC-type transport system involved in cytochrome c biogenesis permease subunit